MCGLWWRELGFWARDCGRVCDVLIILQVNGKKTCGKTSSMPLLGSAISRVSRLLYRPCSRLSALAVWSLARSYNKIYRPRDIISGHIPREPILNLEYAQIPNQFNNNLVNLCAYHSIYLLVTVPGRGGGNTYAHAHTCTCFLFMHIAHMHMSVRLVPFSRVTNWLLSFQSESAAEKKLLSCTGGCIPLLLLRLTSCHGRGGE